MVAGQGLEARRHTCSLYLPAAQSTQDRTRHLHLTEGEAEAQRGASLPEVTQHVGDTACRWHSCDFRSPCLPSLGALRGRL